MNIQEITYKIVIPDGYEFDKFWYPNKGDEYMLPSGALGTAKETYSTVKYHILKKVSK